jgi:dihydrofolate reductase
MKKVYMFNRTSLDGFFAGPGGNIDWFVQDPQVDQALHKMMNLDTVLFGRLTYQMFESYWPDVARDPHAPEGARAMGNELNQMAKLVFSTTLDKVTWENSKLLKHNLVDEVKRLKLGQGSDIVIFGSGTIVQQLAREDLIDEYLVLVTPVILGTGKSLFSGVNKSNFKLLESRSFQSGNVLLHYGIS